MTATNPIDPNQALNVEGVAAGDGAVFVILQAFAGGQAVKHVFQVDPATGVATNLTGNAPVPGAQGRLTTSNGQAAWPFCETTDGPAKLHFYDGANLRVIDTNISGNPHLARGRLVYLKPVSGVDQVFLYDSTQSNAAPVQLTTATTGTNSFPQTDGSHIAWLRTEAGSTNRQIALDGGFVLSTLDTAPGEFNEWREHPFQLNQGQFLWSDLSSRLIYAVNARPSPVPLDPAISFSGNNCCIPWLADGRIALVGQSNDTGSDSEVFLFTGDNPAKNSAIAPFLSVANTGPGEATALWDKIAPAASYNLYMALDPRVSSSNYTSIPGGQKFTNMTSPFVITNLTNHIYFFVVTWARDNFESAPSGVAAAAFWSLGGAASGSTQLTNSFFAVAADRTNGSVAYASGGTNIYKTTDSGSTWSPQAGMAGRDVRALAVDGPRVFAAMRDFFGGSPSQIWRSSDAGGSWQSVVPDGGQIGEQNKSLAVDPVVPSTIYGGDFHLPAMNEPADSFLIKSTDAGDHWLHLPDPTIPEGAELRAYAIAINPSNNLTLYVGGTGTPNLVKSTDGGNSWTNVSPANGYVYSLAVDPLQPERVYAGLIDFSHQFGGLYNSTNGGATWQLKNMGLPSPPPRISSIIIDPILPGHVHLGTDAGYYFSFDAGEHWAAASGTLNTSQSQNIYSLALTEAHRLIAGTAGGLFVLDLSTINAVSPVLEIAREGMDTALSWPSSIVGFNLETTSNLSAPIQWTSVTNRITINDTKTTVLVQPVAAAQFYRLRKP
ncbi:MAG TPA: hypothetical protein VGR78_10425 [Verrucomicrobiae bacterium]|nr:hypothetical protein [Verrucomicrobiae bacterium]